MAKCTETCPRCGAGRTQFEGQTSWKCGSYSMYVPGLNPFWAIAESEHCQARQELAAANHQLDQIANAQRNALTTECLEGVWWAKGSGIVAGPQATEQDVLLEVAENWWRVAAAAQRRVAELEGDAERYRYIRDTLAQMLNPKMSGQHTWRVTTIHATGGTFEEVLDKHMAERPIKADRITPTEPEK